MQWMQSSMSGLNSGIGWPMLSVSESKMSSRCCVHVQLINHKHMLRYHSDRNCIYQRPRVATHSRHHMDRDFTGHHLGTSIYKPRRNAQLQHANRLCLPIFTLPHMRLSKLLSPVSCKPDDASCKRLARPTTNFEPGLALVGVKIVQQSTIVGG